MKYRQFGNSGIRVSEIGVGCGGLGGEAKPGLEPVIERALDLGINFFDTCDTYAETRSEQTLGRVFAGHRREEFILCTKFGGVIDEKGDWHRDISLPHLNEAFAASCRRLRVDYFDIYLVHTPPRDICQQRALFAALDRMVADGKIRTYGLSLETGDFAVEFVNATRGRALEFRFNFFAQDPRREFLAVARRKGAGIIAKSPMGNGVLSGSFDPDDPVSAQRYLQRFGEEGYRRRADLLRQAKPILTAHGRTLAQGALAWLLSFPETSTVIPGVSSLARLEETVRAAGMRLTPEEMAALDALDGGALAGQEVK